MSSFEPTLYMLRECLQSAVANIRANGLRSLLTMLGIIIGVASVIAVVSLVRGLSESIGRQFQGLGGGVLTVRAETSVEDELRGKLNRLKLSDLDQLKLRINGIRHVTPIVAAGGRGAAEIRNGPYTASGSQLGTTVHYQDVERTYPRHGRFLTASDDQTRRRVVVLGDRVRRDLKLPNDPTERYIQIGGEWFKVVGSMEPRGDMFGVSQDNYLLIPYQTALAVGGLIEEPDLSISFSVVDPEQTGAIKTRVTSLLRQLHGLKPGQPNDFAVDSSESIVKSFKEISATVTFVVAGLVGISLLVGGVGIMNIMLVSVSERTREIGIVKALGAPRRYILTQFLMEAVLLAVCGGIVGVLAGYEIGVLISKLIPNFPPPSIPWAAIAGACGFSGLIGMVFGILPASRAARLVPVEALRYE